MHWDVIEVRLETSSSLFVRFADGLTGYVRFAPDFFTGVFERLRDSAQFAQVFLDHGAVAWPGEIDLAPDAMYEQIRLNGEWVLTGQLQEAPV